jgi:hypothetical protein
MAEHECHPGECGRVAAKAPCIHSKCTSCIKHCFARASIFEYQSLAHSFGDTTGRSILGNADNMDPL